MTYNPSYFLGTNTPNGFYSLFSELYNPFDGWCTYIIKGGPGTGKSSLMKKCVLVADEKNLSYEKIFCSSDPNSLDGVIFKGEKISVADGTAPHILEPKFPGAVENIINLGECWNTDKLFKNSKAIIETATLNSEYHKKCTRNLLAIKCLMEDNLCLFEKFINTMKLEAFLKEIIEKEIPIKSTSKGIIYKRFLNGITPRGPFVFWDTIRLLANNIFVIEDDTTFVSSKIIDMVKNFALENGYDIILSPNTIFPDNKFDHIIIPELSLAFVSSTTQFKFKGKCTNKIRLNQFAKKSVYKSIQPELSFSLAIIDVLYARCSESLLIAKDLHDKLESYYIQNMDFDKVNQMTKNAIEMIIK
ncbi:MAG: hypothetical protein RSB11_00965 [Oscillospiraceae bacterium]